MALYSIVCGEEWAIGGRRLKTGGVRWMPPERTAFMQFKEDGSLLVTSSSFSEIKVWDTLACECLYTIDDLCSIELSNMFVSTRGIILVDSSGMIMSVDFGEAADRYLYAISGERRPQKNFIEFLCC
mmetsp:Transcript_5389/g.13558  ORF Transcript_5389/g.13558 Transcript_5389/m.13558 type:complete len:127 (+) Transcript_5389:524-904(+)